MSSILTNNSAMTALQTLKGINSNLQETQSQISTGKAVGSAKDNSAVWAISKVMESDVKGFQAISKSLTLGDSTIAVARNGSERVSDLLTDIKGKIVDAQEENVDRSKIQTDIDALTDQIKSVVGAAQFNGLNLLQGTDDVNILSALNRSSDGAVEAKNITVNRADLSSDAGTFSTSGTNLDANATASAATVENTGNLATITVATAGTGQVTLNGTTVDYAFDTDAATTATALAGQINALGLEGLTAGVNAGAVEITSARAFEDVAVAATGTGASSDVATIGERAEKIDFSVAANVNEGDGYKVTIGTSSYDYVAGKGETMEDVARGLKIAIDSADIDGVTTRVTQDDTTGQFSLKVDNSNASVAFAASGLSGGEASGGLFGLDNIDVTQTKSATAALDTIEALINIAIDASADFGSAQGRIENQSEFISSLTDSLKSGIGSLVDADLEEASARLQALQVQQQLGVQALSIANQAPQSLLSLFR